MYSGLKNQNEELVHTKLQLQFVAQHLFIYYLLLLYVVVIGYCQNLWPKQEEAVNKKFCATN